MPFIHSPGIKHLAHRARDVSLVFEMLRQRHDFRQPQSEHVLYLEGIEVHVRRVWPQSGQKACPRGCTQRHLTVVGQEDRAAGRQAVHGRRFDPIGPIAAEQRLEVVDGDEEDVRFLGGR